mmetsp:Transcript_182/g.633  ORF Transcript_182/g.633 Transcript_182/m.633 type:complete len:217 (+) Transcript_182:126-776(+)
MSCTFGRARASRLTAYGMGISAPVMRSTGASKSSKHRSMANEAISEPMPHCGQPSSILIILCVFFTLFTIVSSSRGRSVRRLMTSASIPNSLSSSAAFMHSPTCLLKLTKVMSLPSFITLALPIGTVKSLSSISGVVGNSTPYIISFSMYATGSLSRMAAFMSPRASSASYGARTFNPGMLENHEAKHWECCAPTPEAAPLGPRNTMAELICPADM